jgi:hypothetical protein
MLAAKHIGLEMSSLSDKDFDSEGEARFRRGYCHGAQAVFDAVKEALEPSQSQKLEIWLADVLRAWQSNGPFDPPAPPTL